MQDVRCLRYARYVVPIIKKVNSPLRIGLTFAEVGAGPSVQEQFCELVVNHTDGTHERRPIKAEPGLHVHACPQQTDHIKSGNEMII